MRASKPLPLAGLVLASLACTSSEPAGDTNETTADATETDAGETETGETGLDEVEPCPDGQGVDFDAEIPQLLSDMCLVRWDGAKLEYEANVYHYDLNTELFSDYALKDRAIFIPPGTTASYRDNAVIDFPVGTVILKSFYFPADMREPELDIDLVETRVLVRFPEGWKAYPYIWDHGINDAVLTVQGEVRVIEFIGPDGLERTANYLVPQRNQCLDCHELKDDLEQNYTTPIGPWPRHLNRPTSTLPEPVNQLQHFADAGWLEGLPPLAELPAAWDMRELATTPVAQMSYAEITRAARDYLDINCAYCHNPLGVNGISSQLFLNWDNEDEFHLGFCKKPGSAGKGGVDRDYNIVPGDAEASILVYRTETLDLGSMMPLIGRSLKHDPGAELLRAWIDGLPSDDCQAAEP